MRRDVLLALAFGVHVEKEQRQTVHQFGQRYQQHAVFSLWGRLFRYLLKKPDNITAGPVAIHKALTRCQRVKTQ